MRKSDLTVEGSVTGFDAVVGLGSIEVNDGRTVTFHAISLADGSRRIGVGASVRAKLRPAHGGVWEATVVELVEASFPCRVCGGAVPGQSDDYAICQMCGWEDDPVQSDDPAYGGGANATSLDEARASWLSQH
jgi:Cysteine-rich CPCC